MHSSRTCPQGPTVSIQSLPYSSTTSQQSATSSHTLVGASHFQTTTQEFHCLLQPEVGNSVRSLVQMLFPQLDLCPSLRIFFLISLLLFVLQTNVWRRGRSPPGLPVDYLSGYSGRRPSHVAEADSVMPSHLNQSLVLGVGDLGGHAHTWKSEQSLMEKAIIQRRSCIELSTKFLILPCCLLKLRS